MLLELSELLDPDENELGRLERCETNFDNYWTILDIDLLHCAAQSARDVVSRVQSL